MNELERSKILKSILKYTDLVAPNIRIKNGKSLFHKCCKERMIPVIVDVGTINAETKYYCRTCHNLEDSYPNKSAVEAVDTLFDFY